MRHILRRYVSDYQRPGCELTDIVSLFFCNDNNSASKAALVQMTKSAGVDYAKNGIRTNCVLPGMTSTGMISNNSHQNYSGIYSYVRYLSEMTTKNTGVALEQFSPFISRVPINRWSTPGEVSNAILFLAVSLLVAYVELLE